jgi:glycosyltransferase involved in cell wall biosynthesis
MKKKILFVTLSFEGGGAEKILSRLIHNLNNEFSIVLVTFYNSGRYLEEILALPGIEYHCLNAEHGNTFSFALRLHKIIDKTSPGRILSFLYYPNIVTYLALTGLRTPFIVSERSNHRLYLTGSFKHKVWRWLLKLTYKKAESVITVSEESGKAIEMDFKVTGNKISTIYNGLSFSLLDRLKQETVTELSFDNSLKYIIAVGSFNRAKNYQLLIESFNILYAGQKSVRLIILGKGELENDIRKLIATLNLSEAVLLPGYNTNPYKFMAAATCYVLSSRWEGFPNSLLEAMYINGHVVSTNCPTGPSEIITHNVDGLLCEPDNPDTFAAAIEKMCFDDDFRKIVFENSRIKIAKFDESLMINNYRELLNRMVN